VWAKKASESDPLMTCRNRIGDIKTGPGMAARDEPGGSLLTGQAVSGMEVARARVDAGIAVFSGLEGSECSA
jgi:hypothetical protein